MRHYNVNFEATVSATPAAPTDAIGIVTGTSRTCQIYEVHAVMSAVISTDGQLRADLFAVSALTAGAGLTPANLEIDGSAAVTTASSSPTGVTTTGNTRLALIFNVRSRGVWVAQDPDSRIGIPSNGGAAGSLTFRNSQPGTIASQKILHQIFFAE